MKAKSKRVLHIILAVTMVISILPTLGGVALAAVRDMSRPTVYTLAEGNLARAGTAFVTGHTNAWQTAPTIDGGTHDGVQALAGGSVVRINDGVRSSTTVGDGDIHGSTWNAHGITPTGAISNVDIRWDTPQTIDSLRVMWGIDATSGSGGVQRPANAAVQYWNGTTYVPVTNLTNPAGAPVTTVGLEVPNTGAHNTWNGVYFDPVSTTRIRLVITNGANGVGIYELEVFESGDPLLAALSWVRNQLNLTNLEADVSLPTTHTIGEDTFTFTYVSSNPEAFGHDGRVTRPGIEQPNAYGTLIVTASDGVETVTDTLNWSVRALLSNKQIVDLDIDWINIGNTINRTTNFVLPTAGPEGSAISWSSGGSSYLWDDGTVLRPPQGETGAVVTLTATASYGEADAEKSWEVTIEAWPVGGRMIVRNEPVVIEQPQGTAPKLPNEVLVDYSDGTSEMRRVRWGRNSVANQTTDAGRAVGTNYTITGNVMGDGNGDGFVITADVTVVEADRVNDNVPSSQPVARALPLHAVTIDTDPDGTANILTQNRTGWTSYIVNQDVTRFIHPFRTAYGLSTAGYESPEGWTGKLRGFGSGHYISALAMAYSTPTLSTSQRNTLIRNMERITRELRVYQEMTMNVPHPTEDRFWEGRDFFGDIQLDGTATPTESSPPGISDIRDTPGDWTVMRMGTSPWGTLANWLSYASSNDPNEGPRTYGHGYLNAIPPHHLVGNEAYLGYNDGGNGVWAPYYGLHKIFAGLIEIYYVLDGSDEEFNISNAAGVGLEAGQNTVSITAQELADRSLEMATDMGLWIGNRLTARTQAGFRPATGQPGRNTPGYRDTIWGTYIAGEYGGINESLARLSVIQAEKDNPEKAALLEAGVDTFWNDGTTSSHGNIPFFTSLANNRDSIRRLHANTHIPMMVGSVWAFRSSTDEELGPMYWRMAENFLDYNVGRYSWATGNVKGHRDNIETYVGAYGQVPELHVHTGANETCANYNLMKLNKYLNEHDPTNAKYLDHIEKLFTCQMVGSTRVGATNGSNTYHYPVHLNASKSRGGSSTPDASCCAGTAIENHVKYQDAIFFESLGANGEGDGKTFYVGLYMPATATWAAQDAVITQSTVWPSERSEFTVEPGARTGEFEMMFRVPAWAKDGFDILLNDESIQESYTPSTYVSTGVREWSAEDKVIVIMPFDFWIDFLPTQHTNGLWVGAMMYGPVLMAARGVSSWQTLEISSYLTTGAGTNITLNGAGTVAAAAAGTNAPSSAVNNVHTMTLRAGGNSFTLYPHYIVESSYTTYFYIRYIDESVAERNPLFAKLVEAASYVNSGFFTEASAASLQTAITTATGVYQNLNTTEAQLDAQIAALNAAIAGLEQYTVDLSGLNALIAEAEALVRSDYTWDSLEPLDAALAAAKAVAAAEEYTAVQVVVASNALRAAIDNLIATAALNRAALLTAIETAQTLSNPLNEGEKLWPEHEFTIYTRRSWGIFQDALTDALKVRDNDPINFNQSEVDAAAAALREATNSLNIYTQCDERDDLRAILDEAIELGLNMAAYTPESRTALAWVLSFGEDRYVYASLTFLEKHSYIEEFREIMDNLELIDGSAVPADYGAVNAAIAAAEALDRELYTEVSIAALDTAIDAVDWDLTSAEQAIVDGFEAAILEAYDNLVLKVTYLRIKLNAITRVSRNSPFTGIEFTINEGADCSGVILTLSNPAMAEIGPDGRSVQTFNRAGTVTLTATDKETSLRHSVTLMIT